jgi:hypothetical protein
MIDEQKMSRQFKQFFFPLSNVLKELSDIFVDLPVDMLMTTSTENAHLIQILHWPCSRETETGEWALCTV